MPNRNLISDKTIGRLSLYRRVLLGLDRDGTRNLFSHQLASLTGGTAAQVRRDVMAVGYSGSPTKGYDVPELIESIDAFLDDPDGLRIALVGVGNLGRALLDYYSARSRSLSIEAAFDTDEYKVGRVIHGCRCWGVEEMARVIQSAGILVGIIAVPAGAAQAAADQLIRAGVQGLQNFAPIPLRVPSNIYIDNIDLTMSLEKVSYFARGGQMVARQEK
ncbi:MAG: redox-sensing transcriptional repressor Rex [Phycisphaerae bacterium]